MTDKQLKLFAEQLSNAKAYLFSYEEPSTISVQDMLDAIEEELVQRAQ